MPKVADKKSIKKPRKSKSKTKVSGKAMNALIQKVKDTKGLKKVLSRKQKRNKGLMKSCRALAYKEYAAQKGYKKRTKLEAAAVTRIKEEFADPEDQYTGYKSP